jgi:hypothetical protein
VRLWDVAQGRLARTIDVPRRERGAPDGDIPLAFAPDGKTLVSRSGDWSVDKTFLWDTSTARTVFTARGSHCHNSAPGIWQ